MPRFTRRQRLTALILALGNFATALCYSIQAPLLPPVAENVGATPSEYGLIFGIYELISGLMCLASGKFVAEIGAKFMCSGGLFLAGGTCVLFGLLDKIIDKKSFLVLAYLIRILEATGSGAFYTASFSIIAKDYPENSGSVFSVMEAFYGFGMIMGPSLGGVLYSFGGYTLPFALLGSILIIISILGCVKMPADSKNDTAITRGSYTRVLKIKTMFIIALGVGCSAYSLGSIQVGLEPLLRSYGLTPLQIGLMFIINGAFYAITTPIWGVLTDKFLDPSYVVIIGSSMITVGFILVAPAPWIPVHSLWLTAIALVLQGSAMGANYVGTYLQAQREAIRHGMPDDLSTYGVICGLWNFVLGFGLFLGPSLTGVLIDLIGYGWATQIVVVMHLSIILLYVLHLYFLKKPLQQQLQEHLCLTKSTSEYNTFKSAVKQGEERTIYSNGSV